MAIKKSITLKNTSTDELYIDSDTIVTLKRAVKTDLKNIVATLNQIEKHYKTLLNHKATKGEWKTTSQNCINSCNKYEKKLTNDSTNLENCIDDAIQRYVLSQIEELKNAQSTANF